MIEWLGTEKGRKDEEKTTKKGENEGGVTERKHKQKILQNISDVHVVILQINWQERM